MTYFRRIIFIWICAAALLYPCTDALAAEDHTIIVTENGKNYVQIDSTLYYYVESLSSAANYVRGMIETHARDMEFALGVQSGNGRQAWDQIEKRVYSEAKTDADYLELLVSGLNLQISDTGLINEKAGKRYHIYYYKCTPDYYVTLEQKNSADRSVKSTVSSLGLKGKSDYEKIKLIYRSICQNVDYDMDYDPLAFSLYGGLVRKKAVCQGCALAFYALAKEAGLNVGIVCGTATENGFEINHAWNVVKLNGAYYYLDPTWDLGEESYSWFMKGASAFMKGNAHKADSHNNYRVSSSDYSLPLKDRKVFDSSFSFLVTGIKLTGISKKIAAGQSIKLTAKVTPAYAENKQVAWKSSNKKIAKVSKTGKVTINKKAGGRKVTITATAKDGSGKKKAYKIKVMKGKVKKISFVKPVKKVKAGKKIKLKVKVIADKGANKKLIWKSSNKKYATVTAKGLVKIKKAGKGKKVKITAMATDGTNKKKSVTIRIK